MVKSVSGVIPQLPTGVHVADKPADIEFLVRGDGKWVSVVESLKMIDATKCVQIDVSGIEASKQKVNCIKNGIRHMAKVMGYKPKIKFAIKGSLLYVWANNR